MEPSDLYEDDNGQAEGLTDSTRWGDDMDTTDQPGEMPAETLVECTVADPSEHACGWNGRAGGSFDAESGVLELSFVPYSPEEMDPEDEQDYAPTTVRFVEVEKLLTVLARLEFAGNVGQPGAALLDEQGRKFVHSDTTSGEWWRAVLAEKLDAHKL